jgi:hypothetical protein
MLWAARVLARTFGTVWELLSRLRRRPAAPDPAEELRLRLAEARARDTETASAVVELEPGSEPEPAQHDQEPSEPASSDAENLRRDVHARGRALSDEMRGASGRD